MNCLAKHHYVLDLPREVVGIVSTDVGSLGLGPAGRPRGLLVGGGGGRTLDLRMVWRVLLLLLLVLVVGSQQVAHEPGGGLQEGVEGRGRGLRGAHGL
jgi:hypothetical protein